MRTIRIGPGLLALCCTGCGDDAADAADTTTAESTGAETSGHETSSTGEDGTESTTMPVDTGGGSTDDDTSTSSTGAVDVPPLANADTYYVLADDDLHVAEPLGLFANDVASDGEELVLVAADPMSAQGGTVAVANDGSFTFVPAPAFWGSDSFEYTIADPQGSSSQAIVTIHVAPRRISADDVASGHGGFVIYGEPGLANVPNTVDGAGDVDGDGRDDIVVGTSQQFSEGPGRAYVVLSPADNEPIELSDVALGDGGFAIEGIAPGSLFGFSVSAAGDMNDDDLGDIIVGAPFGWYSDQGNHVGHAYVLFGKDDGDPIALTDIEANEGGFAVSSAQPGDVTGRSVGGAGDVNGDGRDDLVVGAPGATADTFAEGKAYVVFGADDPGSVSCADIDAGTGGFVIRGDADFSMAGYTVAGAGDVDGDGLADLLVTNTGASYQVAGRGYVVFGKDTTTPVELADVAAGAGGGFALVGDGFGDSWWTSSGAGDVDGDGHADVLIGAGYFGNHIGRTYVVFGKSDPEPVALADVSDGTGGFAIDGSMSDEFAGEFVAGAGDVNDDGLADIVLAARTGAAAYVVYGKADGEAVSLLEVGQGEGGFAIDAMTNGATPTVGGAGDVDGDGVADIILDTYNSFAPSRTYVVFGVPTQP